MVWITTYFMVQNKLFIFKASYIQMYTSRSRAEIRLANNVLKVLDMIVALFFSLLLSIHMIYFYINKAVIQGIIFKLNTSLQFFMHEPSLVPKKSESVGMWSHQVSTQLLTRVSLFVLLLLSRGYTAGKAGLLTCVWWLFSLSLYYSWFFKS